MIGHVNKVMLMGEVARAPETRDAGNSTVTKFRLATKQSRGDKTFTEWHTVVVWGDPGKNLSKLQEGDMVAVFGELRTRSWEKDGVKRYSTEVAGFDVLAQSSAPADQGGGSFDDDDIPY